MELEEYATLTKREQEVYIDGVLQGTDRLVWAGHDAQFHNSNILRLFKHLGVGECFAWSLPAYKGQLSIHVAMGAEPYYTLVIAQGGQIGSIGVLRYIIDIERGQDTNIRDYFHNLDNLI